MSVLYSHISDKYVDSDLHEVVTLSNGDIISNDDDASLLLAYERGLLTEDEMMYLGFDKDELPRED
jgi:hypothetical protein